MATKAQIEKINKLVEEYKVHNVEQCAVDLLQEFGPFLKKQTNRFFRYYQGVHDWDHAFHESEVIFLDLLREFTIGGDAYFTVFIQRKLPLRLRYFFIKEIKRRSRDLSHSDEQFQDKGLIGSTVDVMGMVIDDIVNDEKLKSILGVIYDGETLSDREKDMLLSNIIHGESHERIAVRHDISRSRVSRIIKSSIEKIQMEVRYRD